jgi:hypothetical protein
MVEETKQALDVVAVSTGIMSVAAWLPPVADNTFDFYPNHNCTVSLMMTKPTVENYGINPIEVGRTIYDPTGFAGGIREWSTSNSQLTVNYSDATVKVSGDIGGTERVVSDDKLHVGNSASGTTLGTVTKKIEVFNEDGISLGFIPVYATIT